MIEQPRGTLDRPIIILSEEEELLEFNRKIEEVANKALVEEAIMIGQPLSVMQAVVKSKIPGSLAVKNQTMEQEILAYYHQRLNIKINSQFFTPKIEPNYSSPEAKPNLSQFVLYGVDFLSTNQIRDHFVTISGPQPEQPNQSSSITQEKANPFSALAIRRILWVNDSTCKLIFKSSEDARLIINSQLKDQSRLLKDDGQIFKGWFQLKPYNLYSFQRPLFIRYSTTMERTIIKSLSDKYSLFEKAQSSIIPELLKKFNGEERYQEILKQIELEKNSKQKRNLSPQPRVRSRDTNKPNNFAQCQQMPPYKNNYKRTFNNDNKSSNEHGLENRKFNKDAQKSNNQMEDQNSLSFLNNNSLIQANDESDLSMIGNNKQNHLTNQNINLSYTLNDKMVEQNSEINSSLRDGKQNLGQKAHSVKEKMVPEEKEYEHILPPQLLDQKQNQMDIEVKSSAVINLDGDSNNNNSEALNNELFKQICQIGDMVPQVKQQQRKSGSNQNSKVEDNKSTVIENKPKVRLQTIQKIGQIIFNPKASNNISTTQTKPNKIQEVALKGGKETISVKENTKSLIAKQTNLTNQVKVVSSRSQGVACIKQGQQQKQVQIKQTQDYKQLPKQSKDTKNASNDKQVKPMKQKGAFIPNQQSLSNSIKQKESKSNGQDIKQKKANTQEEYKWNILEITTNNNSNSSKSYGKTDNRSYNKDEKTNESRKQNDKRRDARNSVPEPEDHGEPISY